MRYVLKQTITARAALVLILCAALATGHGAVLAQGDPDLRPPTARLNGLRHEYQTWCNCGPVNLMMALSYYGWPYNQTVTAAWLKPSTNDKNVSPHEMVAFVDQQTELPHLRALWRYGGNLETVRRLIAAGFPVIVESGFQPEGHEWMGHYITVVGYEDPDKTLWTYDSYTGYGMGYGEQTSYEVFDGEWSHFNRAFVVVYPADRTADVMAALGPLAEVEIANQAALAAALDAIARDPAEVWAHFNAGTSANALELYAQAAAHYDTARAMGLPFRMLWYQFGPFDAYYHIGRYYDVLALVDEVEAITTEIEETFYWRGLALAALGNPTDALAHLDRALAWNPNARFIAEARAQIAAGEYVAPAPLRVRVPALP